MLSRVAVWIQKEQWILKVGLIPYDHLHTYKAQKSADDRGAFSMFEATLLDIASGIFFCSNYNKTRCLCRYLKLFTNTSVAWHCQDVYGVNKCRMHRKLLGIFGSRPSEDYFRSVYWFVCLFVCLYTVECFITN